MQNAVNNLIYNTLIANGSVALPSIGCLIIVRRPASVSGGKVFPPKQVVEFSSRVEANTIIDYIVEVASVDMAQAEDIYRRWLDKVRTEDGVVIEGVGELRGKTFVVATELLRVLNPAGDAPMRITRRHCGVKRLLIIVALLSVAVTAYFVIGHAVKPEVDTPTVEHTVAEREVVEPAEMVDMPKVESIVESVEEVASEPVQKVVKPWNESDDIRHWVVVGTYSTADNAERAKRDAERKVASCVLDIFRLGSMYAVVAFGDVEREACEEFKRAHRAEFPQAWIHTPKRRK